MSWLARSLANSLGLDPESEGLSPVAIDPSPTEDDEDGGDQTPGRGVKEDISELTETLTRQLRGVASFLAPPPEPHAGRPPEAPSPVHDRSGEAEASGSEIFAPVVGEEEAGEDEDEDEEDNEGGVIGVTEEVLAFARNISMHPETWLDCPLLPDEDEPDDFVLSKAQQEHALAIEYLVPRLAALRIELCPVHLSEGCFWKIYFVLLHPRLHKEDAEYLSTPQIVEARAMMLQELQNRMKLNIDRLLRNSSDKELISASSQSREQYPFSGHNTSDSVLLTGQKNEETNLFMSIAEFDIEKHPCIMADESEIADKVVGEEQPELTKICSSIIDDYGDEDDAWLEDDEDIIQVNSSGVRCINVDNEDISFSDLEDSD